MVSANTAKRLGLATQNYEERDHGRECYVDTIKLSLRNQTISQTVPAWIMPGQPDDVITIHLGYGRKTSERMWDHIPDPDSPLPKGGFNAYDVRFSDQSWTASGASVSKAGDRYLLATTQTHFLMTDPIGQFRDLLRVHDIEEYEHEKHRLVEERQEQNQENHDLSVYPEFDYHNQGMGYAWGMSIDL